MKVISVEEMRVVEKSADANGISYDRMMQNAGKGIADWLLKHLPLQKGAVGLVGSGNNGGDTLIALTELSHRGVRTIAFLVKQREKDPLVKTYLDSGGSVICMIDEHGLDYLKAALIPGAVLLDGILGTGVRLPIRGDLLDTMIELCQLVENRSKVIRIAVDCPSGVDCNTGEISEAVITADHTLCMAAIKQGLLKQPARSYAGTLHGIEIGISDETEQLGPGSPEMLDSSFVRENLPDRQDSGHKGSFGTCLVVAGSKPYTGAAFLTGKGAYRAGCGLVHVGTTKPVYESLSGQLIEAVWTVLPEFNDGYDPQGAKLLSDGISKADSIVIGPGWGLQDGNIDFLKNLLPMIPKETPALFDADGLKLLTRIDSWWTRIPVNTVLTPHPGEMSILTGLDIKEIQENRWEYVKEYARRWGIVLVLKGAVTVIASPDGQLFINPVSNSALATAGSGDVLSGVIGGLLAQHVPTVIAAASGVWVHAQGALAACEMRGEEASVTAKDILDKVS